MLHYSLVLSLDNTSGYWVVDSWASCHATTHRKFFHDYVQGDFGHALLGDDEQCKIARIGRVHINLNTVGEWILKYVRNISSMKKNLI